MKKIITILIMLPLVFSFSITALANNHGEPPIEDYSLKFQNWIFQETDENKLVVNFNTKQELKVKFSEIMTMDVASYYVDTWYKDTDDGLHLIAKDGPLFLDLESDYTVEMINENYYKVTQHGENKLKGNYTVTIDFEYRDGKWLIVDRQEMFNEEPGENEEGGELPVTSTTYPTWALLGLLLAGTGLGLNIMRRKQAIKN